MQVLLKQSKKRLLPLIALFASALFFSIQQSTPGSSALPQALPAVQTTPDGALTANITLDLPIGTGGATPALSLSYNSRGGNSLTGAGWNLSGLAFIARDAVTGINYDGGDDFSSSMHGRLVSQGGGLYYSRLESFTRYQRNGTCGDGPCGWTVRDRTGNTYHFGETAATRILAQGRGASVRIWALERMSDARGNSYQVVYDQANGSFRPSRITYANRIIEFSYTGRADGITTALHNAPVSLGHRLSEIRISAGHLTRHYELEYDQDPVSNISRLIRLKRRDTSASGTASFQDLVFTYSNAGFNLSGRYDATNLSVAHESRSPLADRTLCDERDFWCGCTAVPACWGPWASVGVAANVECANRVLAVGDTCENGVKFTSDTRMAGDIDGDGRLDILRLGGVEGDIRLRAVRVTASGMTEGNASPVIPLTYDAFRQAADINGDGRTDFAFGHNGILHVMFSNGNTVGGASGMGNVPLDPVPVPPNPATPAQTNAFLADMDADGRTDFVRIVGGVLRIHYSAGNSFSGGNDIGIAAPMGEFQSFVDMDGDGRPEYVRITGGQLHITRFNLIARTSWTESHSLNGLGGDGYRWLGDVNGDGRPDFMRIAGDRLRTALYLGNSFTEMIEAQHGAFSAAATQDATLRAASQPVTNHGQTLDLNGDGKTDLVFHHAGTNHFFVSRGDSWHLISAGGSEASFAGDVNGDGRGDLVQVWKLATDSLNGNIHAYFQPAAHANLLTSITANLEQRIDITYQSAAAMAGAINTGGPRSYDSMPDISSRWLVASIAEHRGHRATPTGFVANHGTTTYQYTDGRVAMGAPEIRKSLGFAGVAGSSTQSGVRTETDFHQTRNLAGSPSETRGYLDGVLQTRTVMNAGDYEYRNPNTGTELVLPRNSTVYSYQGGSLLTTATRAITYDAYGNTTRVVSTVGGTSTTVDTTFENDTTNWFLGRPLTAEKRVGAALVERQSMTYAGANLATRSIWLTPGNTWLTTSYEYDGHGNVTAVIDPLNRRTEMTYDGDVHRFVVSHTNALGHVETATYDTARGLKLTSRGPNGSVTTRSYDAYGRPDSAVYPGETGWSVQYVYSNMHDTRSRFTEIRRKDGSQGDGFIWNRTYADGTGQTYRTEGEGFTDGSSVRTVVRETYRDARGRVIRSSNAYIPGVMTAVFTINEYNGPDGRLSRITRPDSRVTNVAYSGLTTTTTDAEGRNRSVVYDNFGRPVSKVEPLGMTTSYSYSAAGKLERVTDAAGGVTTLTYDSLGRKITQRDPNTGITSYEYDAGGRLIARTDARSLRTEYQYDALNRIARIERPDDKDVIYTYDEPGVANGIGHLTRVRDPIGETRFSYTSRGRIASVIRRIDQYTFNYRMTYDAMNRPSTATYPDGSVHGRLYSPSGHLHQVRLANHPVVTYLGPLDENGGPAILRATSNGVRTVINFDPTNLRPDRVRTRLSTNELVQDWEFTYNAGGQITRLADHLDVRRTRDYEYDALGRMTRATGRNNDNSNFDYRYNYHRSGNLLTKGDRTLEYNDALHPHAVTAVTNAQGTTTYQYDAAGNMIRRGSITLEYDTANKLSMLRDGNGQLLHTYFYDDSGRRIKKKREADGAITYSVPGPAGMYELRSVPGQTDQHTIYVKGARGELVSQWTRTNVTLTKNSRHHQRTLASRFDWTAAGLAAYYGARTASKNTSRTASRSSRTNAADPISYTGRALGGILFRIEFEYSHGSAREKIEELIAIGRSYRFLILFVSILLLSLIGFLEVRRRFSTRIYIFRARPVMSWVTPVLTAVMIFTLSGCVGVLAPPEGEDTPPWMIGLSGGGITSETPVVSDDPSVAITSGGGNAGVPVNGMYFFHPDHQGSIRLITDANGNHVQGVDIASGKSYVSYKPYGQVEHTNSNGPDIFRYKYTAQELDSETGLYYYKARYYDPQLGRFLQSDSQLDAKEIGGMNPYMYVNGNPISYVDPSGNNRIIHMFNQIVRHMAGGTKGISGAAQAIAKGVKSTVDRIAKGKAHKRNDLKRFGKFVGDVVQTVVAVATLPFAGFIGIAYGLMTNPKAFVKRPLRAIYSYFVGGLDFALGLAVNPWIGKPDPIVQHKPGGALIHNSFFSNVIQGGSFTLGGMVAHIETGASRQVVLHERGHIRDAYTGFNEGENILPGYPRDEWDGDLKGGTLNYTETKLIYLLMLGQSNPELVDHLYIYNAMINPDQAITLFIFRSILRNYNRSFGINNPL